MIAKRVWSDLQVRQRATQRRARRGLSGKSGELRQFITTQHRVDKDYCLPGLAKLSPLDRPVLANTASTHFL
jgi:hypothetical protein